MKQAGLLAIRSALPSLSLLIVIKTALWQWHSSRTPDSMPIMLAP